MRISFSCENVSVLNSSPPSAAYIRQSTGSALLQVMACRLFGAKPLPELVLANCQLDSWKQISVKIESEYTIFIEENAFEIVVCQTVAAILFRGI